LLQLPFVGYRAIARLPQEPSNAQEPPEMLVTEEGFLAIDTPRGWLCSDGPGLAYFVPPTSEKEKPLVWIYISAASVGAKEQPEDMKAYIESDKAGFKQRFKNGVSRDAACADDTRETSSYGCNLSKQLK
jgi:hypothetical protein